MLSHHQPSDEYGFSQYVRVPTGTSLAFISGQSAYDPARSGYAPDFAEQVEQCFRNLLATIAEAGGSAETVVKVTTLVVDLNDDRHNALDDAMKRHFPKDHYPASTLIPVPRLSTEGMMIEIDAVVAVS